MSHLTIQRVRADLSRTREVVYNVARVDKAGAVWLGRDGGGEILLSHPEDHALIERHDDGRENPDDPGFDYAIVTVVHCPRCRS